MNYPSKLVPDEFESFKLKDGSVVEVPKVAPKFSPWTGPPGRRWRPVSVVQRWNESRGGVRAVMNPGVTAEVTPMQEPRFRIITWNVRRATAKSPVWDYLLGLEPDLVLLQEVGSMPVTITQHFCHRTAPAMTRNGTPQRFRTVILVRGELGPDIPIRSGADWVNAELQRVSGNILASEVTLARGTKSPAVPLSAASIYSPAWPIDRKRLAGVDVTGVKLTLSKDVWIADLLWSAMQHDLNLPTHPWVVAGDFNLSETFDLWRGGPRGNLEYLDRMSEIGLVECLRRFQGALTPTYRNIDRRTIKHQMDHLFVGNALASSLLACSVGEERIIFDQNLSDHLPIIADFQNSHARPAASADSFAAPTTGL
jgi:exonuclease III